MIGGVIFMGGSLHQPVAQRLNQANLNQLKLPADFLAVALSKKMRTTWRPEVREMLRLLMVFHWAFLPPLGMAKRPVTSRPSTSTWKAAPLPETWKRPWKVYARDSGTF